MRKDERKRERERERREGEPQAVQQGRPLSPSLTVLCCASLC
jgi:hypothetical protein